MEILFRAAALMRFPLRDFPLSLDAFALTSVLSLDFTLAHLAFCASDIFRRAAALSRVPRRDDAGATALLPPFSPANADSAASTRRSWFVKFVFSARSSTTIASTPVMFAMAGIIAEVLSACGQDSDVHFCEMIAQRR